MTPLSKEPKAANAAVPGESASRGEVAEDCQEGQKCENYQAGGEESARDTSVWNVVQPMTALAKYTGHGRNLLRQSRRRSIHSYFRSGWSGLQGLRGVLQISRYDFPRFGRKMKSEHFG